MLERCREAGYQIHIVYLWLPSAELAVARVRQRVLAGGHDVPDADVRRRWARSLLNLFERYIPLADSWVVIDGSAPGAAPIVAQGRPGLTTHVVDAARWNDVLAQSDSLREEHGE